MTAIYEIFADEAWTHSNPPPNRYWCFYGGVMGRSADLDRLDTALRAIMAKHAVTGEVKWKNLSASNLACYKELIDELIRHLRENKIIYRQMFLDRTYVWQREHDDEDVPSYIANTGSNPRRHNILNGAGQRASLEPYGSYD